MKREKTFRERLWEEATGHCIYCGKPVSLEEMEADHIVPLCQGGDNSYENKVCSCPCCNARKAGLDLEEFLCKNMGKTKRKRFSNRVNHLAAQGKMSWEKAFLLDPYSSRQRSPDFRRSLLRILVAGLTEWQAGGAGRHFEAKRPKTIQSSWQKRRKKIQQK